MSVAFTKEDSAETASETLLSDRPISPHPNLVTGAGLKALEFQLQRAREAYESAQKIDDVNERRRQAAAPLRDARYFVARVRTAQVIPNPTAGIGDYARALPCGPRHGCRCRNCLDSRGPLRLLLGGLEEQPGRVASR